MNKCSTVQSNVARHQKFSSLKLYIFKSTQHFCNICSSNHNFESHNPQEYRHLFPSTCLYPTVNPYFTHHSPHFSSSFTSEQCSCAAFLCNVPTPHIILHGPVWLLSLKGLGSLVAKGSHLCNPYSLGEYPTSGSFGRTVKPDGP
jgi:hypothetical protein